MDQGTPFRVVYASAAAHVGGYIGLAFTALLAIAGFVFNLWLGLFLVVAVGVGVGVLEMVRRADRLALYEDGIAHEYKLISTSQTFTQYDTIQDIEVTQSVTERLLGIGTLHINTAGSSGQEIVFHGIKDCHEVEASVRARMRPRSVDTPAA